MRCRPQHNVGCESTSCHAGRRTRAAAREHRDCADDRDANHAPRLEVLRLGSDEIEVCEGVVVRVDPEVTRQPVAGDEGLQWVAIGSPKDGRYEPPAWG